MPAPTSNDSLQKIFGHLPSEGLAAVAALFSPRTVEPCLLLQAPAARLRECLSDFQAWEPLRTQLLERLVTHKLEREYHLLVMDGRTRYAHFCASAPQLAGRVPLAQLATYLGMTDVSLSRIRRNTRPDSSGKSPTATG